MLSPLFTDSFLSIVKRQSNSVSILTDGEHPISYRELHLQAQSIAIRLKPNTLVAICIEKSADYIAALLGCWYAGAAFMPLDPDLPDQRQKFILNDAKPDLILARQKYTERLNKAFCPIICIEDVLPAEFTVVGLRAEQLAYVIYTSGSTGTPKGVIILHQGIESMLQAQIKAFHLGPSSRSLFLLSTAFDASISDIGTALLSGATLCIETDNKIEVASRLQDLIHDRSITYVDMPPSLLRLLSPEKMPGCLDTIVIGGEICPPDIVKKWTPYVRLINVYGPTEATVCTSLIPCNKEWSRPLIGYTLPGVDYYIFDQDMNLTDNGELYIGGRQLALGYLNQEELTKQKFIFYKGQRLYRTGDRVRRHIDEEIEFIGRMDRQIKLRGQLVELEEIEMQLSSHPAIKRIAVLSHKLENRDTLTAHISLLDNTSLDLISLREWAKPILPEWMIPGQMHIVNDMPLTISGKIDASALKEKFNSEFSERKTLFKPETEKEYVLLNLWRTVLKKNIGRDDHFFDVGGDSLAVLELSLEAERKGIPLTPSLIVKHPLFSDQLALLQEHDGSTTDYNAIDADVLRQDIKPDVAWLAMLQNAASRPAEKHSFKNVFLTGATGFLGGRLLRDLLAETNAHFYVLIRSNNADSAWKRLGLSENFKPRLTLICGDFSLSQCGMNGDEWSKLANIIDTIVHCGAAVNMVLDYSSLRPANVEAVKEMVRLACTGKRKNIHYASTLSVFVSTDHNTGLLDEDDTLDNTKTVYGGYGQTKWAAEYLLQTVPAAACHVTVYRLGLITGDTIEGKCAERDFINMFVKGLVSLGCVPEGPHETMEVDVTPVNYASRAMASLISRSASGTFHIANKKGFTLTQILHGLKRMGHFIEVVPLERWMELKDNLSSSESAAYMALGRCLPVDFYKRYRVMDLFQGTDIDFNCHRVEKNLAGTGIYLPRADDELLDTYLNYILQSTLQ